MNLNRAMLFNALKILIITTVVTTMTAGLVITVFTEHGKLSGVPPLFVMTDGAKVITKSRNLDAAEAQDIKMTAYSDGMLYIKNNVQYNISVEETAEGLKLIHLIPVSKDSGTYALFSAVFIMFIISFFASCGYYGRKTKIWLTSPLSFFCDELFRISEGNISASVPECAESAVSPMFCMLEKLRIKLKDAVFYKNKIDENRSFLMSSISHDLKTPVTAVGGYLEGVLDGVADTEEKKRAYLLKAAEKNKLISVMIEELLYFSKLDLKQVPFNLKKISIGNFAAYAVSDNEAFFEKENKSIAFVNKLTHDACVLIDEEKFQRVVQNIIDNAKKYTNSGGSLTITLFENSGSVVLEFKDDGCGIKESEISHIFDKFYRGDSARKIEGSSGLGLAIAKRITEGMGGRIWAVSKENEGTSVMISLSKA